MIKQDFAKRVYQRMVALNLRQAELAERAGLTRNAISRYVRGMTYPSQASLLELAKALECEPTDLLAESDVLDAEANRLAQARVDRIQESLRRCRFEQDDTMSENKRYHEALEECLAWFSERADGEYIDGKPVGNAEMKMEMYLREVMNRP